MTKPQLKAYIVRAYRMIGDVKFTVSEGEYRPDQHDKAKIAYKSLIDTSKKFKNPSCPFDFVEIAFVYEELVEMHDARPE